MCSARASIIGVDFPEREGFKRPFELAPLTKAQLDWFIDVERVSASHKDPKTVDGMYTLILRSIEEGPEFQTALREHLAPMVKIIIDEGLDHYKRFSRAKEAACRNSGESDILNVRTDPRPALDGSAEKILQDTADASYEVLLRALDYVFKQGVRQHGAMLEAARRAMYNIDDANRSLAEKHLGALFTLPAIVAGAPAVPCRIADALSAVAAPLPVVETPHDIGAPLRPPNRENAQQRRHGDDRVESANGRKAGGAGGTHRGCQHIGVMRGRRIRLRGTGPAAFAAAKLLLDRGAEVVIDAPVPRKGRMVSVPMETVALAAHLFEIDLDELKVGCIVRERRVDWSTDGPAAMPEPALVCDDGDFSAVLTRSPPRSKNRRSGTTLGDADWIIDATGVRLPLASAAGKRVGYSARIACAASESFHVRQRDRRRLDLYVAATPPEGWRCCSSRRHRPRPIRQPTASSTGCRARVARSVPPLPLSTSAAPSCWRRDSQRRCATPLDWPPAMRRLRSIHCVVTESDSPCAALCSPRPSLQRSKMGRTVCRCVAHYEKRIRGAFIGHLRGCCAHYRAAPARL
jgi:hypothetical protein